jgi:putative ABC transport system permease protein
VRGAPDGERSPRLVDLLRDVLLELSARRARSVLIIVAVALSTGALLASVGISTTAARQIASDLAASTLDLIVVSAAQGTELAPEQADRLAGDFGGDVAAGADGEHVGEFPADAESRVRHLDLVEAAGHRIDLEVTESTVVSRLLASDRGAVNPLRVSGVSPGYFEAAESRPVFGRDWFMSRRDNVVVLGVDAAEALGVPVSEDPTGYQVMIGRERFQVIDFVDDGGRVDLSSAVLVPYLNAVDMSADAASLQMLVRVSPGGGAPVAGVVREALRPDSPERLMTSQIVNLGALREGVDTQLGRLAAGIGVFLLALATLLITNSMIVSVAARTGEIGLRRALGASRSSVSAVFWCEGLVVGVLGGLSGSALSMLVVSLVALGNQWTVDVSPWLLVVGPVLGGFVGLLASAYPAWRAARTSPASAVRSD